MLFVILVLIKKFAMNLWKLCSNFPNEWQGSNMNIITKTSLVISSSLLLNMSNIIQAEEVCSVENCIQFNNTQLSIPSDYILNAEFKDYPKYIKSVDNIPVSALHVKDRSLCSNFCDKNFKGELFAGGDGSKRLRYFHQDDYSTSLWDIQFTNSEATTNTALGIIYNDNTMLQITEDKSLWLELIDQLKNKKLESEILENEAPETEVLENAAPETETIENQADESEALENDE